MLGPDDFEMQIQQEEIPGIQPELSIPPAQDEQYGDFIVRQGQNIGGDYANRPDSEFLPVNETFGILYVPLNEIGPLEINSYTYVSLPKCYALMDVDALNASGITRLHNHPYLELQGEGTVIAVIDSGIDYENPIFRSGDISRIAYIWDQTILGNEDERVPYGKVFTGEEISRAIMSENPREIVPSVDENGHGTAIAGLAAGNFVPAENFSGAAPKATIIVVKLKEAKSYLREFYQYPPQAQVYQENDIMIGISFAVRMAKEMGMPVSICLGLGSSQGAHTGDSELSRYLDYINEDSQVSVSVAAGNVGAAKSGYGRTAYFRRGTGIYYGILGKSSGRLCSVDPVTGRRKPVCEQFSWRGDAGIEFCFCGDEGVGKLCGNGTTDGKAADLFSVLPSGGGDMENECQ